MLYKLLLFPARIFIHLYFCRIVINKPNIFQEKGPLLIAANHPNSFLDAIVIAALFKHPVHSLARGDAFHGKSVSKILRSFNMLPVYRVSEGIENLEHNYTTFETCQKIFQTNGIVLIFSEGKCINEWHLRPLKKGTARLALDAWQQNIPLKVLPLGINYSNFKKIGKILFLNFGNTIVSENIRKDFAGGRAMSEFNTELRIQLQSMVFEIDKDDTEKRKKYFQIYQLLIKKIFLFVPAIIGVLLNAPLFYTIHFLIRAKANEHYDSIMAGLLFFIYPFYILIIALAFFLISHNYLLFSLLVLFTPITALSLLHFKKG